MGLLLFLILDIGILWLWHRYRKDKTKKLAWYWTWLGPTTVISLILFSFLAAYGTALFALDTFPLDLRRTEREMTEIEKAVAKYRNDTGHYPANLDVLIGKNPIRKEWKLDCWGTAYQLISNETNGIQLYSAGADSEFNTADDLVIEIKPRQRNKN